MNSSNKTLLSRELNVSRGSLYYQPKQPHKDWCTKVLIEEALRERPAYGHKRLALHLKMNKKKVLRVMNLYGIKPYRRHGKKYKNTKNIQVIYPNMLLTECPQYENHIWASDFTYLKIGKKTVYACTVMDLYTKKIIGLSVMTNHTSQLTISALMDALTNHPKPKIFHSDNGKEYDAKDFKNILNIFGIQISRSKPGCPWENGYQESFYGKFKIELGELNRFHSIGELTFNIYQTIHYYNNERIHTTLKMSPNQFAQMQKWNTMIRV
jgi:putative transposase